ncbi:MAG: hypothetical protein IPO90_12605 [Flavobacteriales bacterium]|nr:hypothetical protein [Flavobacteriales bacterium]
MANHLFDMFSPLDAAAWEALILKELKGADPSSIAVKVPGLPTEKPFATSAHQASTTGFRRGVKQQGNAWRCTVGVDASDPANANKRALDALMGGADALEFYGKLNDHAALLNDIWVGAIDLQLDGDATTIVEILRLHGQQNTPPCEVSGCIGLPHDMHVGGIKELLAPYPRLRLFSISDGRIAGTDMIAATHRFGTRPSTARALDGPRLFHRRCQRPHSVPFAPRR